jgi:cytochrome c1
VTERLSSVLLGAVLLALALPGPASAEEESEGSAPTGNHAPEIASQGWSFAPPFGRFDRAQLQRGYQVYEQICSGCHSMRLLSYRNLGEPGGPEFSPKAVEVLAAKNKVPAGPDDKGVVIDKATGQPRVRPALPSDQFRSPFPNEQAARDFNKGALPPDLSVIAKARPGGPDYLYALLTGYKEPPQGFELAPGMNYNVAFPGHQIAMAPPLADGVITYTDGTKPTLDNYARDVSAFLMWAAEPKLEERYKVGARVMIFLLVFAGIMFLAKRAVWAPLHRHKPKAQAG